MQYEFRVWNDPRKMPKIIPKEAEGRLDAIKTAATTIVHGVRKGNPDILIDADGAGDDAIKSAEISYFLQEVKNEADQTQLVRAIRMKIHGNLYLPLQVNALTQTAKSMAGFEVGEENARRNTVLLSAWANCPPPVGDKESLGYYRAVVLSVLTKAGDFRVITAKKVYVESYSENYAEGEFGTFELVLAQRIDAKEEDTVIDGVDSEKQSVLDQIKGAVDSASKSKAAAAVTKAAEVVATAGVVLKVGTTIAKKGIETYEKFHGETEATRRWKYGLDTAGAAGDLAGSGANIAKSIKNDKGTDMVKNISNEVNKANDNLTDHIQKGADVGADSGTVSLAQLEAAYLANIKKNPDAYKEYLESSYAKKREMLEEYAQKGLDRAAITKAYESSQIDVDKAKQIEEDMKDHKLDGKVNGEPIKKKSDDNPSSDKPSSDNPAVVIIPTPIPIPTPPISTPIPVPTPTPIPIPTDKPSDKPSSDKPSSDNPSTPSSPSNPAKPSNASAGVNLGSGGLSSQINSAALKKSNGDSNDSE